MRLFHVFIIFFVCLLFIPGALSNDMFFYNDLELRLLIENELVMTTTGSDPYIDHVSANLSWFPKEDYRQDILSFTTSPHAERGENLEFKWHKPDDNRFQMSMASDIITKNRFVEVHDKVNFPLRNVPYHLKPYLKPGTISDVDPDITVLAAELSEGKDDLYEVVFTLGDWVKENIDYKMSSTTTDASQKASWVLENREGVCDELTSLFISMCRSLGIPAKFVSGMSYTDMEGFENTWGPHGWAEVYFPGVGWVPFDVTYRQMGYLDSTHIKLKETLDAKSTSIEYMSRGRNIRIQGSPLEIEVDVKKKGTKVVPQIDFNVFVKYDDIGFGSYNLVWAEVENIKDYYVTADLSLSRTEELELVEGKHKTSILLKPDEKKTIYWIVKPDENLNPDYSYTFTIDLRDIRGAYSSVQFESSKHAPVHSYSQVKTLMPQTLGKKKSQTEFSCTTDKGSYRADEQPKVACKLKNLAGLNREYLVCLSECRKISVPSQEMVEVEGVLDTINPGINNFVATASYTSEEKRSYLMFDVFVKPEVYITNITFPEQIRYEEQGTIAFRLSKNPDSTVEGAELTLVHDRMENKWVLGDLEKPQEFEIKFFGSNLKRKDNDFVIKVDFKDEEGLVHSAEQEFSLDLVGLSFGQKIMLFFDELESKIFG